ncbi:MAG TPA: DNA-binding protein [Candidatus Methanoperedenaceae archaeon]|nr:DNA-binding protein [Candidatus Methanoperedenaceae archaeon]
MTENDRKYVREPAKRIFAQEFRESDLTYRESDDIYSPQYLITPTGARINRLFITGTMIEKEDIGSEVEYWRARITDPTGVFLVYAGQYQQEAAETIATTEPPEFMAVIGKQSLYTTPEGTTITSIRPESIQVIDEETVNQWIIDTAEQKVIRLQIQIDLLKEAGKHYQADPEKYKEMIATALDALNPPKI